MILTATHVWDCKNDWDYCTLTDCKIINNTVMLDNAITGSILSDIRDSTSRIHDYGEIIPIINIPTGSSALLYIRSGWYEEYTEDTWTDWKLINEPEQRIEYTLSLTTSRIVADYDIKSLTNIYYGTDYAFHTLATNLRDIYLSTLDNVDPEDERYSSLWSGIVDDAIVDFAKTDNDGEALTIYAQDAATVNNVIVLKNPLPDNNVVTIIKYISRYFVYSGHKNRYFQFKIDLEVDPVYLRTVTNDDFCTSDGELINLGEVGPTVTSIIANYRLDFQHEMQNMFPRIFRRL
jgi:hypothetical protein